MTLTVADCFLVFNVVSVEANYAMGYLVIGLLSSFIGLSLLATTYLSLKQLIWRLRVTLVMLKYKRARKSL